MNYFAQLLRADERPRIITTGGSITLAVTDQRIMFLHWSDVKTGLVEIDYADLGYIDFVPDGPTGTLTVVGSYRTHRIGIVYTDAGTRVAEYAQARLRDLFTSRANAFVEVLVFYAGGFHNDVGYRKGIVRASASQEIWHLCLTDVGVGITHERHGIHTLVRAEAWEDVSFVSIEEGDSTLNPMAIVAFGVLGLGTQSHRTAITVGFDDGHVTFWKYMDVHEARRMHQTIVSSIPQSRGVVMFGPPTSTDLLGAGQQLDHGERLATLYASGALSDEEFARLKRRLIDSVD